MYLYNVTGKANTSDIISETEDFEINVCAACKRDAYEYVHRSMTTERGYTTCIPAGARLLGAVPAHSIVWAPGTTLRIS